MYIFHYPVLSISLALQSFACLLASSIVILSSFRVSLLPLCHMAQMSSRLFSSLLSPSTTIRKSLTPLPLTHHPSRLFLIIIPAQSPRSILITPVSVLSHAPKNWKCPGYCFNTVICGTLHYTTTSTTPSSSLHCTIIIIPKTSASRQKVLDLLFHFCCVLCYTYFVHSFGLILHVWKGRWKGNTYIIR
jgi:hypothetical protein